MKHCLWDHDNALFKHEHGDSSPLYPRLNCALNAFREKQNVTSE